MALIKKGKNLTQQLIKTKKFISCCYFLHISF